MVNDCCYLSVVGVKQFLDFVDQDVTNAVERLSLGRKYVCSELPQRAAVLIRRLILNLRSLPLYLQVRVADGGGRCLHGRSLRFDGIDGFADVTVTFRCHSVGVYCEKRAVSHKMNTNVDALNCKQAIALTPLDAKVNELVELGCSVFSWVVTQATPHTSPRS